MTHGVADEICGIRVNLWLKTHISHCLRNNVEAITRITTISFFHRSHIAFGVCLAQMVSDISQLARSYEEHEEHLRQHTPLQAITFLCSQAIL